MHLVHFFAIAIEQAARAEEHGAGATFCLRLHSLLTALHHVFAHIHHHASITECACIPKRASELHCESQVFPKVGKGGSIEGHQTEMSCT